MPRTASRRVATSACTGPASGKGDSWRSWKRSATKDSTSLAAILVGVFMSALDSAIAALSFLASVARIYRQRA